MPNNKGIAKTPGSPMLIGIDFDCARIVAALVDETGRIATERRVAMPTRTTRAAVAEMASLILELASSQERESSRISAISVSVDGQVDPPTGRVTIAGLKGWMRVATIEMLEEALAESGHDIRTPTSQKHARAEKKDSPHPTMMIYPRSAAIAAGEAWRGAARGKANVVYLSLGETFSAGIIADGHPILGTSGNAGAAGWLALTRDFMTEYVARGCFATEAGNQAFARHAIEAWSGITDSLLGGLIKSDPTAIDTAMIFRSTRGGDDLAEKVVREVCRWTGRGIANMISILNPDAVVIGGELGAMLKSNLDDIREEARRWANPAAERQCRIVCATLGEKAGVIGAVKLSLGTAARSRHASLRADGAC